MSKKRRRFHPSNSELYIALRSVIRKKIASRVNAIAMEHTLHEVPDIKAKIPVTFSIVTQPSEAEELGRAGFWETYEERVWRRLSPKRKQRIIEARAKEFAARVRDGEEAVVAFHEGKLVGACWFTMKGSKPQDIIDFNYEVKPGEAYLYQGMVDIKLRGRRIYTNLLAEGLRHLKAKGVIKVNTLIEEDNFPQIVNHEHLGFRHMRLIKFRRLFTWARREEIILDGSK